VVDIYSWARGKPATHCTYLEDSYTREVEAEVLDFVCNRGNKCHVVFDKTVFHPKGGGQPSDTGVVVGGGVEFHVLKVLEVGGVIVHYGKLVRGLLERGLVVKQLLDWDHRYCVMRLHTAGHILDYAVMKAYGKVLNTVDANHGPPRAYVVYEAGGGLGGGELELVERIANEVVGQSRPVRAFWVKREELPVRAYNAPNLQRLPLKDLYRVVEIEGVNAIPCTGTHVKNTVEVGGVKIVGVEWHPAGFKVYYDVAR